VGVFRQPIAVRFPVLDHVPDSISHPHIAPNNQDSLVPPQSAAPQSIGTTVPSVRAPVTAPLVLAGTLGQVVADITNMPITTPPGPSNTPQITSDVQATQASPTHFTSQAQIAASQPTPSNTATLGPGPAHGNLDATQNVEPGPSATDTRSTISVNSVYIIAVLTPPRTTAY